MSDSEPIARLLAEGAHDELLAALSDPDLPRRAAADPSLAATALAAAAALAWRNPGAAVLAQNLGRPLAPAAQAEIDGELLLATRFAALRARGALAPPGRDVPTEVIDVVADHRHATPDRRAAMLRALAPLVDEAEPLRALCDGVAFADPPLAAALLARVQPLSRVWGERALAPLSAETRAALDRGLHGVDVPGRDRQRAVRIGLWSISLAVCGAFLLMMPAHRVPTLAVLGIAVAMEKLHKDWLDRTYRENVRPQLGTLLGTLGVQSDCIGAWIGIAKNRRRKHQLGPYASRVVDDRGLALFAAFAAVARENAG